MPKTTEHCDEKIEEILCEDRISSLPDDLLVTILLSVPLKDAAATMILSKRWRFMWTMLPILVYKESDVESKNSVWDFLDKSLELHKAPLLGMYMQLGPQCPLDADVGKWVATALDRGLALLIFELRWSADPTSLPMTLYSCKSLKILRLSHKVLVDLPSSIWLPSLQILELNCVVYKNEDSLKRFLSSCPVLESMTVTREKDDNVKIFTVKAPYLLDLSYGNYMSDDDEEDTGRCLVIDTPALTYLDIADYSGNSWSIENTPCLEEVYFNVDRSLLGFDKFLRSFSKVLFLELILTDKMIVCFSTIEFSRLTKCKLFPNNSNWMDSLVNCCQKTNHQPPIASMWWSQSISDPECLSSSLEKFELIDYGGREEERELVEYILTTSICLKTATISLSTLKLEDEDITMKELKAIPRRSSIRHTGVSLGLTPSRRKFLCALKRFFTAQTRRETNFTATTHEYLIIEQNNPQHI
ncbi:hypothetical protein YC2023_032257 [Brassica napus]